jgi:hypothetical protein
MAHACARYALRFWDSHIGTQNGVHAGEVAFAAASKPLHDVIVEAQVHRRLSGGQNDARGCPELPGQNFGFRCAGPGRVFAAHPDGLDFAKGISR